MTRQLEKMEEAHKSLYKSKFNFEYPGDFRQQNEMIVNMGPQHPSTHGVINFMVETDGEVMKRAVPDVGYLHRSIEKIGEKCTYNGFMPYTDRVDYVAAMFANQGYAMAVEKLLGAKVPRRAEFCRVIACELCRIASHCVAVGTMSMDVGAITPFPYALREREAVNDLEEELCGARLTYNYLRIGGVAFDVPGPEYIEKCSRFAARFIKICDEFDRLITENEIFIKRLAGLAVIPQKMAIDYGLVGPNLRASGMDWDVRRDLPYSVYPELEFEVPVGKGLKNKGVAGDCWDRFWVRVQEMRQSARLVLQACEKIGKEPEGEIMAKVGKKIKPPAGAEAYSRIESARGEMQYYVVSDGTDKPYRTRARCGSFTAMGIIEDLSKGLMIADLVALIASFDVVAPEIDR
jgi:NADH-quinone oxidoreductase subunit D